MDAIKTIRQLLDEMPVLTQITKDLPYQYQILFDLKIKELQTLIENAHTREMDRIENINKDEENYVIENFFGQTVKTETFNSDENEPKEPTYLDKLAKKHKNKV